MKIIYTSKFAREYKKLSKEIQLLAEEKEKIFREDSFNSILQTHKLHGKFKDFRSFSIDFKYRIIFEFGENNVIYFHSIGDHSIYK
ncbi:type II toxin-antitoxin system mRNA interferase toxin, RelE/StbE family [Candidatus Wolfebacteria bacterium]|nr:type II toxin-antitoxin system mRNA interferase toxin, RelE/StbE family [Candidatus Wolfebacteria bacterium]